MRPRSPTWLPVATPAATLNELIKQADTDRGRGAQPDRWTLRPPNLGARVSDVIATQTWGRLHASAVQSAPRVCGPPGSSSVS
jgi:hypothetical protein